MTSKAYEETRKRLTARLNPGAFRMAFKMRDYGTNELAAIAGVSPGTISNMANAKRKTFRPDIAGNVARALGVKVEDIFFIESCTVQNTEHKRAA